MRCSRSCAQAQCCVCCLLAAAESQAEAETSQSYFMPFIIFFFPSCVAAHTQHLSAAGRNGCGSCQSKCSSPFVQVVLQLGTRMCVPPFLPQAPGKKLGEGRWAVNDLSLGMGITQVVTGRGEAPQPPSAARNQLGQHRAVDFQALW